MGDTGGRPRSGDRLHWVVLANLMGSAKRVFSPAYA